VGPCRPEGVRLASEKSKSDGGGKIQRSHHDPVDIPKTPGKKRTQGKISGGKRGEQKKNNEGRDGEGSRLEKSSTPRELVEKHQKGMRGKKGGGPDQQRGSWLKLNANRGERWAEGTELL